jgi:Ca-activated chloride channel homolog
MRNNKNIMLTQSRQDAKNFSPVLVSHGFFAPLRLCVSMLFVFCFLFPGAAHAESVRGQNNRGVQEYKVGDFAKAAETFEQAAKQAPRNAIPSYNAGAAHAAQGNWEKALPFFQKVPHRKNKELGHRIKIAQGVSAYKKAQQLRQQKKLDDAKKEAASAEELNKQVLRENAKNNDARINMELATNLRKAIEKELKEQQNQQQDQKKDDKKQDQDKKDQNKQDQNQQDKNKQDQQKQGQQNKQDQDKQDQQKQEQDNQQNDSQKQDQEKQKKEQQKNEQDKQKQDQQKQDKQQQGEQQQPESAQEDRQDKEKPADQDASLSVLNLLDSNNDAKPLKEMMKQRYGKVRHPEKDW